ncbi:MAG: apolipoprotein N-acyltransferase, partial [Pseudomonadales bacterium]
AVVLVGALAGIWLGGYGMSKLQFVHPAGEHVSVSLVQGNVDQATKWQRNMVNPILNRYTDLTRHEWGRDLIVWPEAAITLFRENAGSFLDDLGARARSEGTTVLLGIPDRDDAGNYQNTAIALGAGEGSYSKRRLVPFGEYVPMESVLRGTIQFFDLPMSRNRPGPDDQLPLFAGRHRLSLSICYEVVYPELVRTTVDDPDLLVTISNDTWFGRSIGPEQHLQMAQMRALENGRYMVRGTNNGITAVVDHKGLITARLPRFEQGVLRSEAKILEGKTPYSRWGSWPLLILVFGLPGVLWLTGRRFR